MNDVSIADARRNLAELLNRVAYAKERVILTRHGKEVAALVPLEDLGLVERLARILRRTEVAAALQELEGGGSTSWDELKEELGL